MTMFAVVMMMIFVVVIVKVLDGMVVCWRSGKNDRTLEVVW